MLECVIGYECLPHMDTRRGACLILGHDERMQIDFFVW